MSEHKYVCRCMICKENYAVILPYHTLQEDRVLEGFCSNECISDYVNHHQLSTKRICHHDVKYLKEKGHHELADWISWGGLEILMEQSEDEED